MSVSEPSLRIIRTVRSQLKEVRDAPRQGPEGAPRATLHIDPEFQLGLQGLRPGDELLALTWLHLARRDVLQTHPRNDPHAPLAGVLSTRSPDRPNPIGLHRVRLVALRALAGATELDVEAPEAVDGTPIVDLKPVWRGADP